MRSRFVYSAFCCIGFLGLTIESYGSATKMAACRSLGLGMVIGISVAFLIEGLAAYRWRDGR